MSWFTNLFGAKPTVSSSPTNASLDDSPNYAEGRDQLQKALGDDIFVAAFQTVEHEGKFASFTIWTDDTVSALPKTKYVWLQDSELTQWFVVPWADLESAIGPFSKIESVEPPRFLFPRNIPVDYFMGLTKSHVAPPGFPEDLAKGYL